MKKRTFVMVLTFLLALHVVPALAQEMYVYPAKGQSKQQTESDKFACYTWAKQQTGFDPMKMAQATSPPPSAEAPQGGLLRGGARGAAGGAIGGAIAGNAGKGAAIGAAVGGLFGGIRRREQEKQEAQEQQKWAQEQAVTYSQNRKAYDRAYKACLEGKGYTVQ